MLMTMPASARLKPSSSVSASGMNASQPRKATASRPRTRIPDGRPRAARSVPAGSSARSEGIASASPASGERDGRERRPQLERGEERREPGREQARAPQREAAAGRRAGRGGAGSAAPAA